MRRSLSCGRAPLPAVRPTRLGLVSDSQLVGVEPNGAPDVYGWNLAAAPVLPVAAAATAASGVYLPAFGERDVRRPLACGNNRPRSVPQHAQTCIPGRPTVPDRFATTRLRSLNIVTEPRRLINVHRSIFRL